MLRPALRFLPPTVLAVACISVAAHGSARAASFGQVAAQGVELAVKVSWAPADGELNVERRSFGGDWTAVARDVSASRWFDDSAVPGVRYEYRLADVASGDRSAIVAATADETPGHTGPAVSVSRVQSLTRVTRCVFAPSDCGGGAVGTSGSALKRSGFYVDGPALGGRDRGAIIRLGDQTRLIPGLETRECDGGGVEGTITTGSTSHTATDDISEPLSITTSGLAESVSDVTARIRVSGPINVSLAGSAFGSGHHFATVSLEIRAPSGQPIAPAKWTVAPNGVDEVQTVDSGAVFGRATFSTTQFYGFVPAGSTAQLVGTFPQGLAGETTAVNSFAAKLNRPGACAPALSTDGRTVVVPNGPDRFHLDAIDTATGVSENRWGGDGAALDSSAPAHPTFTPDGALLYARGGAIWRIEPGANAASEAQLELRLPGGEWATDPLVLPDGSLAVVGARGVWLRPPGGEASLVAPGAGDVGVDGAGALVVLREVPDALPADTDAAASTSGAAFFHVAGGAPLASWSPGETQLFSGAGANGVAHLSLLALDQQTVPLDVAVNADGSRGATLPTLSGSPDGLWSDPPETVHYPVLTSERRQAAPSPTVDAPAATRADEFDVRVTPGVGTDAPVAARVVIAGNAVEAPCEGGCAEARRRVAVGSLAEGTYRVFGVVRDAAGIAGSAHATTKVDRTAPRATSQPQAAVVPAGTVQITWPSLTDPKLADGTAGSGVVEVRARPLDDAGAPAGAWVSGAGLTVSGLAAAKRYEVTATDNAGNAQRAEAAPEPAGEFDASKCQPVKNAKARKRLHLGISMEPEAPVAIAMPDDATAESMGLSTAAFDNLHLKKVAFAMAWNCFSKVMSPAKPTTKNPVRLPDLRYMVPIDVMTLDPGTSKQRRNFDVFLEQVKARTAGKERPDIVISASAPSWSVCDGLPERDAAHNVTKVHPTPHLVGPIRTPLGPQALGECGYPDDENYRHLFRAIVSHTIAALPGFATANRLHWTAWNEPTHAAAVLRWIKPEPCTHVAKDGKCKRWPPCANPEKWGAYAPPKESQGGPPSRKDAGATRRAICRSVGYWLEARGVISGLKGSKGARYSRGEVLRALPVFEPTDTTGREIASRWQELGDALEEHGPEVSIGDVTDVALHPYGDFNTRKAANEPSSTAPATTPPPTAWPAEPATSRDARAGSLLTAPSPAPGLRRIWATEAGTVLSQRDYAASHATPELSFRAGAGVLHSTGRARQAPAYLRPLASAPGVAVHWFYYSLGSPARNSGLGTFDSGLVDPDGHARPVLCGLGGLSNWSSCTGSIAPAAGYKE